MSNGLRIERNGWSEDDGAARPPAPTARPRPGLATTIAAMATASGRATTVEGLCSSVLDPLRADGRLRTAWMGVTMANATVVFEAGGPAKDGPAVAKAAQALERSGEGLPCALPGDVAASLPGSKSGESARGVALPPADPWRGWIVVAASASAEDVRDIETLLAAAGGFAGLALARLAAVDRSRVAEARLGAPAAPGAPAGAPAALAIASVDPGAAADEAAPGNGVASSGSAGPAGRGSSSPPAHGSAKAVANGTPKASANGTAKPGNGAVNGTAAPRTLLSSAALDGIRSFVEVTPGCKSPKLAEGSSIYVGIPPRDASRWIARLLVAAAEGLRTLRVAVEADKPVVRIESDGPLASRASLALASVGDEMGARGGSLKVEDAASRARILATFPKA